MNRTDWALLFARPRIRWLSFMVARVATMLVLVGAVLISWDLEMPGALVAFLLCVLAILFLEAIACDRRRPRDKGPPHSDYPVRHRRETDL